MDGDKFGWRSLASNIEKVKTETNILIESSRRVRGQILHESDPVKVINLLADDTQEFNSFHAVCRLLKLVSPERRVREAWERTDKVLCSYVSRFNTDGDLYDKLSRIAGGVGVGLDNRSRRFLDHILKCFNRHGLGRPSGATREVQKLWTRIQSLETRLIVSRDVEDLLKLIRLRGQYAKMLQYSTYVQLRSDTDITTLKSRLKDLISRSHETCHEELRAISKACGQKRVGVAEISAHMDKLNDRHRIDLTTAMDHILGLLSERFNLEFARQTNVVAWAEGVNIYTVRHRGELYGYMYLDLGARPGKLSHVLSIILSEAVVYPNASGILKLPVTALVGNFAPDISYRNIIDIFREMGNIVHTIFHRARYGSLCEPEMKSFMPYLMECFAYDLETITRFFGKRMATQIHEAITADRAFRLKYRCINTLYDYLLHGSVVPLTDGESLLAKYREITRSILSKSYDLYLSPSTIPEDVLFQLIYNGGTVHSDIANGIMAYNLYDRWKADGVGFITGVLRETELPFRDSVQRFLDGASDSPREMRGVKRMPSPALAPALAPAPAPAPSPAPASGPRVTPLRHVINHLSDGDPVVDENTNYFTEN